MMISRSFATVAWMLPFRNGLRLSRVSTHDSHWLRGMVETISSSVSCIRVPSMPACVSSPSGLALGQSSAVASHDGLIF